MLTFVKYRMKCFMRNKVLIFWTLLFPVALTTIFYFVFSDIKFTQELESFPIAVVDEGNESMKMMIDELSDETKDTYLFDVSYVSKEKGKQLVEENKVDAMVVLSDIPCMECVTMDYNATITKSILNTYQRVYSQMEHIAKENPEVIADLTMEELVEGNVELIKKKSLGSEKDMNTIYFYTALSMLCMYGALWGNNVAYNIQANQSKQAARLNVAPVSKRKIIFTDFILAYLMIAVELGLLLIYMKYILGVEFGTQIGIITAVCLSGILMTLSCGILIGSIARIPANIKVGMISGVSTLLNALAGMMGTGVPYLVATYIPFLKYINPADLISGSFGILYYYEDISRVYINIAILLGMAIALIIAVYIKVRRESYASL